MKATNEFYDLSTLERKGLIGSGGFGKVYKAVDKKNSQMLAVKVSLRICSESSDDMLSLTREVNIMSQFKHPAIVEFVGYSPTNFDGNSFPVIISEYAPNGSLSRMIELARDGKAIKGWDDTQKLICIYGIASAMDYLHSNKTIHRDLKPGNVLLDEFLYPKIADFGLAKILHKEFDSITPQSKVGLKGTSYYLSPEAIEDNEYSNASDVYAFAYIVFETMTNEIPFKKFGMLKIWDKTVEGYRPPFNSTIGDSYKNLIENCWQSSPSKRPSFHQIVSDLESNKGFITKNVDEKKFRAYVDYVKHCKKSFDSKKKIIDPSRFMKEKDIRIEKIDVDEELENSMRAAPPDASKSTPSVRVELYPKKGYNALSKSCQALVLDAEKSAEKQFRVARNLIEGKNEFPKDKKLGVSYLKKSLSQGYIDPEAYGIRVLVEGKVVPRDLTNAKEALTKNMKKTDKNYQILYGKIMKKENKFNEAKNLFEKAASVGSGEAKYELGKMYYKGQGVKSDEKEALKLFSESRKKGCSKSENFLSHHQKQNSSVLSKTTKSIRTMDSIIAGRKKTIKRIGDIDEEQYEHLSNLFKSNSDKAIKESKDFLLDEDITFDQFIEFLKKSQKSNCCIVSWSKDMLSARCLDCQKEDNSCICIPCFLAGKHDQHHSYILNDVGAGNCDCGDPEFWKPSGNCPNHPGPDTDPDLSQMTPAIRKSFITVMKAAFYGSFKSKNDDICSKNLNWIKDFIQLGDGLRRCCSIAITSIDPNFFFEGLQELDDKSITALIELLGQLISDPLFSEKMGFNLFDNYLMLRKKIQGFICRGIYNRKEKPFNPIMEFLNFSFHFFNQRPLYYKIKNSGFNWVDFIIDSIQFIFETIDKTNGNFIHLNNGCIIDHMWYLFKLVQPLLRDNSQHDNLQLFINKYSRLLLKYEASFNFSYQNDHNKDSLALFVGITYLLAMNETYRFNLAFSQEFDDSSDENKQFSISETFSCLVKFLRSEEKNLKADTIYSSSERVPISPFIPLHHLFYCLLSSQKDPIKVITKECKKEGIEVEKFCHLCSIYPLRFLCTIFDSKRFRDLDDHLFRIISYSNDSADRVVSPFFGLFQYLLCITPNKNQLLLNVAKTFGLFDNENDKIKEENYFLASAFIISVLTDRTTVNFDKIAFKRSKVIDLLKRSKPNASEIESLVGDKISNPIFGDDLISYAERVKTSKGSYFKLKNESDFTPFFPFILKENRIDHLNNCNEKLVKLPENQELPHNLSLKKCFRTPVFISLMFKCLQSENKLYETQTGLAMFVLSMQNGPQFESSSYKKMKKKLIVKGSDLKDIIDNLSDLLDNDSVNFSTIKIKLDSAEAISILEIVESNKKIGYEAIEKADIPVKIKLKEDDDEELQRQKKEKAKKLKEGILKEFETRRNVFNLGGTSAIFSESSKKISEVDDEENKKDDDDDDGDDLFKTVSLRTSMTISFAKSQIQCSVCHNTDSQDIIGFPCLSYHSIFPSIINSKLHKLDVPLDEIESVFSLSICTHAIHYNCCKDLLSQDIYKCTIDQGERNCFLPYFTGKRGKNIFETRISSTLKELIELFMKKAFKIEDEESGNEIIAIKSFAGLIVTVEVRHRSRPECLDNANVPFLLRNLLLTLYFYFSQNKIAKPAKNKDPLISLIFKILESKTPKKEYSKFVNKIAETLRKDYLYEFLRRAAIIEEFALKEQLFKESEKFIDWDEIFSLENLLDRYNISIDKSVELPLFNTIELSERFVSLYQPPYNLDIFDISIPKCVDLLTGKVVIYLDSYDKKNKKDYMLIQDYMKKFYKGGLGMFLGLTGPNASDLIYSCQDFDKLFNQDGFYVDQFGDIDRGFKRGAILSLSRDRLESALDKLLSGDVLLY